MLRTRESQIRQVNACQCQQYDHDIRNHHHRDGQQSEQRYGPSRCNLLFRAGIKVGHAQSKSFLELLFATVAGKTLCCGGGMGASPMRSRQRNLLSSAVSTASAWLKSSVLPSFHSLVFAS